MGCKGEGERGINYVWGTNRGGLPRMVTGMTGSGTEVLLISGGTW